MQAWFYGAYILAEALVDALIPLLDLYVGVGDAAETARQESTQEATTLA